MDIVRLRVPTGDFDCNFTNIIKSMYYGSAAMVLIAKSAPEPLRSELIYKAILTDSEYCEYDRNLIDIETTDGSIMRARFIVFKNLDIANKIKILAEDASLYAT
ncbi:uncharacterized protein DMAD_00816 [Drosophila madeirensis]|uniref:Uncharacterized protein n=1 Tax=Drosophila madeirensis TaxID=30013 RepID=A0AAU9FXM7_DROMD